MHANNKSTTVAQYFQERLGTPIEDQEGLSGQPEFSIESPCGTDCARAIDAAVMLLYPLQAAVGAESTDEAHIVYITNRIVLIFIYG